MKSINFLAILCVMSAIVYMPCHGVVKGSYSVVSVEPAFTFPAIDSDNTMAGFGWFKDGFNLQDSTTTCTFDSVYPVSGTVNLNSGTLYLTQDLLFNNITNLIGLGTIIGNNHTVRVCQSITSLPQTINSFKDTILDLRGDISVSSTITFSGTCVILGDGDKTILFDADGQFRVAPGSVLVMKGVLLQDIASSSIHLADDTSSLVLDDITWKQTGDVTFDAGSMLFIDRVDFEGKNTFYYTSAQTSTINNDSEWCINQGMTLSIGNNSAVPPLSFIDESSVIKFDQSNWIITNNGMQITKGTIVIDRSVEVDMQGTNTNVGLIVGNGMSADDCTMQLNSGASLRFSSGYFTYNCASPSQVKSSSSSAQFIRSVLSNIYLAQSVTFPPSTIVLESNLTPPIAVEPGYALEYSNVEIVLPDSRFHIKCDRYNQNTFYLDGDGDSLFLTKGVMPLYIYVSGTANKIEGTGYLSGPITLQDNNTNLVFNLQGALLANLAMNNGHVSLAGDLKLGADVKFTGSGSLNVAGNLLHFSPSDSVWTSTIEYAGTGGGIALHSKLSLSGAFTMQGSTIIEGNNNVLEFLPGGQLVIASGSQLTLKNILLNDVNTSNIILSDDSSSLVLNNCTWVQNGDYHLSSGSIGFVNTVDMIGNYFFIYDSSQTSTIAQKSEWHISNNMTLLIGKKSDNSTVQPLAMTDLTSILKIENSIFRVNSHGIQLTKGTVAAVRDFQVDLLGTSSTTGLILGDNTQAGDMVFDLYPGSSTRYTGGNVTYAITNGNGIKSSSDTTKLARANPSVFWLSQSLALSNITLDLAAAAVLNITPGKTLTYSNSIINIAQGSFVLNGTRYNAFTTLLSGNQSIFLIKGTLPLYTLVSSTNNVIQGNGNVAGAIILQDSNAALTWGVDGTLQNNIAMNGGTLTLANDLNCMNGVMPTGAGTIHIGLNRVNLGSTDLNWVGSTYWDGLQGQINLFSKVSLSNTWTFSGNCVIDGRNHTLDLNLGSIVVEKGSSLRLVNMTLKNLNGTNIQCLDNAGSLTLENVTCQLSNNYNFSSGILNLKEKVILNGHNTIFTYQSLRLCSILPQSTVILDQGLTFSYDSSTSANLLQFADRTSTLILNLESKLHATMQGLNLITGNINIHDNASISSETWTSADLSSTIDNGITLGDCSSNANDCVLSIGGGVQLTIDSGSLNYKNVSSSSLIIKNNLTALFIASEAALNVYQSISMGNAITTLGNFATLARAPGAEFNGSMVTQGVASFPTINVC